MAAEHVGRCQGVLADWNDARGFGFITPTTGGPRVFVHVSSFPRGRRPVAGCAVSYAALRDARNRPRATEVQYVGAAARRRRATSGTRPAVAVATAFFALLTGLLLLEELPVTLLAAHGLVSGVAFLVYGADKAAAQQRAWRTPESTLLALALVGGWPGGLVARRFYRHKTTKQPFRTMFWLTVVANCVVLAWFLYDPPVALP